MEDRKVSGLIFGLPGLWLLSYGIAKYYDRTEIYWIMMVFTGFYIFSKGFGIDKIISEEFAPGRFSIFTYLAALLLVFVVISLTVNRNVPKSVLGFVVGGTVSVDILFAGPLTMASLNPARSLGPALVSGTTAHQWIFVAGPLTGAVVASLLYRVVRGDYHDT